MCRNSIIGLFLVMALSVPLTISGQSLSDYTMTQGTDATKWVTITNTASLLTGTDIFFMTKTYYRTFRQ